jgi:hypothetical protein
MEVERISTKPISMIFLCASLQISRCSSSHFFCLRFYCFLCHFERIQEHPWIIQWPPLINLDAIGDSRDHFVLKWLFKKFKILKIYVWLFPVTVFEETLVNRCRIDARSCPTVHLYKKLQINRPGGRYVI